MKNGFQLYGDGHVHICDERVTEPVSFVHVVDLHLHPEPPGVWPERYRSAIEWWDVEFDRPGRTVAGLLDRIKAFGSDFVFFGGDTLDHYDSETAKRVASLCTERGLESFFQLGNHDCETEYVRYVTHRVDAEQRNEMGLRLCEHWSMPGLFYSFERGNIRFISLDTCYDKTSRGYEGFFDDLQTEWLIGQLKHDGPIIVFHHVPFAAPSFRYRMRAMYGDIWLYLREDENGRSVRSALERCPNLLGTFAGHLHLSAEDPLGEHCQFVTGAAANGSWRYVRIANTPAPKSLRQEGVPAVDQVEKASAG